MRDNERCFFGGGRGLNSGPYIYYALSLPTELSSRERTKLRCLEER